MEKLTKMMTRVNIVMGNASSFGVFCIFLLTALEIFARRLFNSPTSWTLDVQELIQVGVALAGSSYCLMKEGHVNMNLFLEMTNRKTKEIMITANSLVGAIACGVMAWIDWLPAESSFLTGERTESAEILIWPAKLMISVGFALLTIQFVIRTYQHYLAYRSIKKEV
jgi:TRAP-type mannitol/chloroaromatic compound transport system permease small subunit